MKLRVILSILLLITTTFASIHEVEHITHADDTPCFVCLIGDNLSCGDAIEKVKEVETFNFEKIVQNTQIIKLHVEETSNQTRAPPAVS
ncbi:MAG: hypothetical protein Q8S36_02815 [Sulfuricurvum sp.]|nr:hypothetical protein [Sulfuricurvum sp.]